MPSKNERKMRKFDKYVAEMRKAGCVVIAYSPTDVYNAITYQLAPQSGEFEFHPDVDLVQVAQDTHEDDTLWDAISEAVAFAYGRAVAETHFGLEREEVR